MKYLVINKEGQVFDPVEYLKNEEYSQNFRKFIKREALEEGLEISNDKPEYLKYASKMGFNWEENADLGLVQYDYKACLIINIVREYSRKLVQDIGMPIYEVFGSNMFDLSHPVVQAYENLYGDRLYHVKSGEKDLVMSYDASYPQFNLAGKKQIGHKDLPYAHFSISDCYRREQSGECMLFYRQRRFYMPDVHPYFRDVAQAFEWYPKIERQILNAIAEANRSYEVVAEVSSHEHWKNYQDKIIGIARNLEQDILIGIHEDNKDRYWIINVDYKIIDALGQSREIACIQIDIGNAKRLGIEYVGENDKKHNPVIIHSAVPGGIERYIYMIFDNFKESMPVWLYPIQIRLIPVSDKYVGFCEEIVKQNRSQIRMDIDDRAESVSRKIKDSHNELIPYSFVIGGNEINEPKALKVLNESIELIKGKSLEKPFIQFSWPYLLSRRVN
jgi:threonyl-tRNA synthetase